MTLRILITGSREHPGPGISAAIFAAIRELGGDDRDVVIVYGAARGADRAAGQVAATHEFGIEPHPARWDADCRPTKQLDPLTRAPWCPPGHRRHPADRAPYCPSAGPRRNQHMVDLGADICLAFPIGRSPGTRDCIRRARAAGIAVREHEAVSAR